MNKNIQMLLNNAEKEVGYQANNQPQPNRYNKYAEYLDKLGDIYNGRKNGYHFCDIFVDYMFITTFGKEQGMALLCQEYHGLGAGCTYSARYFINNNQFYNLPNKGDQIFFTNDGGKTCYHTGLVYDYDNTYVYTIEGNVSGAKVLKLKHKLNANYIFGYGRPDWSILDKGDDEEVVRYNTLDEIPTKYRVQIKKLIEIGAIAGQGKNHLDLSEDMIRNAIIAGRLAGVF